MNTIELARTAYGAAARSLRTPRATEYEAFARITARLRAATHAGASGFAALAAALHDNRRLWTLLAADVADPDNRLAPALRGQIFYLAEFTVQHSSRVLAGTASAEILVEINAAVMGGLHGERSAA